MVNFVQQLFFIQIYIRKIVDHNADHRAVDFSFRINQDSEDEEFDENVRTQES